MSAIRGEGAIRVGLLGCSDIACRKFIPALLKSDQACFAAFATTQMEKAASLVPLTMPVKLMSYDELLADPEIDLVYISLVNHLHEEWSIRALEQGKHVICEKPLALDIESAKRMLAAADRGGRLLYENIMYLQHPQHTAVKSLIASGRLGRMLSLRSEFAFPGPVEGDFRLDPARGGGAFHDMNRYPLSAAMFFLQGNTHNFIRGSAEVRAGLTVSFEAESVTETGDNFSFLTAFGKSYRSFYEIGCERGSIKVERAFTTPAYMENRIAVTVDGRDESFFAPACDHFLATIEQVCTLIRGCRWEAEHVRARHLAELAGMFADNCTKMEY